MSWCLIQVLAMAIDEDHVEQTALDLFDRLRLREPLAQSFNALGLEDEQGWRAAARLKILLLIEAGDGTETPPPSQPAKSTGTESEKLEKAAEALVSEAASVAPAPVRGPLKTGDADGDPVPKSIIPAALWKDPDVRWLTGYNEAEGHAYVVHEQYEELLWWLSLPSLLKLANMNVPTRNAAAAIASRIGEALAAVEKAGYRIDALLEAEKGNVNAPAPPESMPVKAMATAADRGIDASTPHPEDHDPEEPVAAKPVHPVDPEGPPEDY
jgi:hypothetical protein